MKKLKIPTFIAISVMVLALSAGLIFINREQIFKLSAQTDLVPNNVKVSNITGSSFTVSWITARETGGFLIWGENKNSLNQTVSDEIGTQNYTHFVDVKNLTAGKTYYFKINSAGTLYGQDKNEPWSVTTGVTLKEGDSTNPMISGSVVTATGNPAAYALVSINIEGAAPISTFTSVNGNWLIDLKQLRSDDLNNLLPVNNNTLLEILAQAGPLGVASAQIYAPAAVTTPPIILGQVNDFKNLTLSQNESDHSLTADIKAPAETAKKPKFNVGEAEAKTTGEETVIISNPEDNETIFTQKPEFFGKAPAGKEITITVQSETPQSTSLTVDSKGDWKWSPPAELPPGTHKITLSWRDSQGVLQTVVQNFTVQTAEAAEEPAFESTPSASLTPVPFSTPTASPSAQKTASPSATPIQPISGSIFPSLVLLSAAVLLILLSGVLLFTG